MKNSNLLKNSDIKIDSVFLTYYFFDTDVILHN
jgi:hypothetical protein